MIEAGSGPELRRLGQIAVVAAAAAVGLLLVGIAMVLARDPLKEPLDLAPASGWREIAWPLSPDPWWPSKAFECAEKACGAALTVYVRSKVGFCNCKEGIADDAELERVSDFPAVSRRFDAEAPGQPISALGLKGRSRAYRLASFGPAERQLDSLILGLNSGCDAVVTTGVATTGVRLDAAAAERAMVTFLESGPVAAWVRRTLEKP